MDPFDPLPIPPPPPLPPPPPPATVYVYIAVRLLSDGCEILGVYASAASASAKATAESGEVVMLPLEA